MLPRRRLPVRFKVLVALALTGLAAGAGVATLGGCTPPAQAPKPCDVQRVTLNIYAGDNINPNERGNPRPVVVRLYQLKNDVRMENATYDEILLKDKDTLQDDNVVMNEVEVFPNDLVQVRFERNKDASLLAGVALFHGPKGNSWKTYFAFPPIPAQAQGCGNQPDAGPPQADVKTAFFIMESKIDNGSQFDESMFPNSNPMRQIDLPKKSAASEAPGAAPAPGK
jgi:type VI secretion system protein VasD